MPSDAEFALCMVVATLLSGIVGLERERGERAAGLRTHALVGLGSCLVMLVSAFGFSDWHFTPGALDPSRIAAQVVSGIGFLGAGVIIFQRDREVVRGLTTAASVWVVAAIGLAVGGGMYVTATVGTGITLLILAGLKPLERTVARRRSSSADTRLGLELDAALLPVRDIVSSVQQVPTLKLEPSVAIGDGTASAWSFTFTNVIGCAQVCELPKVEVAGSRWMLSGTWSTSAAYSP